MVLSEAKRRMVEHLKTVEVAVATDLATHFGLTEAAVRQHLDGLAGAGLVERCPLTRSGRGRPATGWRLTAAADELFPDSHDDLSVELLRAIDASLGPDALDSVLAERATRQTAAYRKAVGSTGSLLTRARTLADIRTAEGYVAQAEPDGDSVLLIEHHCPIADAAASCRGLCRSELEVFQATLGPGVEVERVQHTLAGDRRCSYRLRVARERD